MTPDNPRFYRYVVLAAEDMAKNLRTAHSQEQALRVAAGGKPHCRVFHHIEIEEALETFHAIASELGFTLTPIQPDMPAEEPADLVMSR